MSKYLKVPLEELSDEEFFELFDAVSADLKRRNNLLPRPGGETPRVDGVRTLVRTLFPDVPTTKD